MYVGYMLDGRVQGANATRARPRAQHAVLLANEKRGRAAPMAGGEDVPGLAAHIGSSGPRTGRQWMVRKGGRS